MFLLLRLSFFYGALILSTFSKLRSPGFHYKMRNALIIKLITAVIYGFP